MNVSQKHAVNGNLAVPPFPQNMEQIMIGKLIDRNLAICPSLDRNDYTAKMALLCLSALT